MQSPSMTIQKKSMLLPINEGDVRMSRIITQDIGEPKEEYAKPCSRADAMSEAEMQEWLKKWSIKYPPSAVQGTLEQIIKEYGEDAINEVLSKRGAER